jgi:hypothetical protein
MCLAVSGLVVDWTGEGLQVWQERFAAAAGASTVNQLLRKHGIKVCWAVRHSGGTTPLAGQQHNLVRLQS